MDEMETLNGSYSGELTGEKYIDLTTITSLKSSLASIMRSTISKKQLKKTSSISIIKSEEYSTEVLDDDVDEYCGKKNVADFQKNYLEMGQWPEVPVPKYQAFKAKYRDMKQKLQDCKVQRDTAETLLQKYENGEIECKNCENLKSKNAKTKLALEQAVQLSSLLLKEVRRMESDNYSTSY
jgi:hypothetical protein